MNFLIIYDLINGKDYKRLIKELEGRGCKSQLESTWLFSDHADKETADTLRNHFRQFIDSDDRMIVAGLSDYATYGIKA